MSFPSFLFLFDLFLDGRLRVHVFMRFERLMITIADDMHAIFSSR